MKNRTTRILAVLGVAVAMGAGAGLVSGQLAGADPHAPARPSVPLPGQALKAPAKPAVITQPDTDALFRPVAPCRIVDTRAGGGGIGRNSTRSFYVAGTSGFTSQGGKNGGCGVPVGASAVAVSITATGETGNSFVTAYPAGTTQPTSTAVSFTKHVNITGNADVKLAAVATQQMSVYVGGGGATQLVIDVSGYYEQQLAGLIYTGSSTTPGSGYVYSGSPRILSVTWISTGVADVTMDRDVTYCTPTASGYYDNTYYANAKGFTTNKIRVFSWYYNTTTHLMVPVNNYVYLTVTC